MYRSVFTPRNESELFIKLPIQYLEKEVEVIAFEIKDIEPKNNAVKTHEEKLKRAFEVFDKYRVSTEGYKFDRDEANER